MSLSEKISPDALKDLIQNCEKGHRHSQSRLYELFAPNMFVVCLRYSRNREEAEESLQEGFMRVFEYIHQFRFNGSFEGWIRKIMVNSALQKFRKVSQMRAVTDIDSITYADMSCESIFGQIGQKELMGMVQQLPPAYRVVFNLYVFEGLKHREIATLLNISEGTSKSNLFDARLILQKAIISNLKVDKQMHL